MSRLIKIRPNYLQVAPAQLIQRTELGAVNPTGSLTYRVIQASGQPTATSPTGRNPQFLWTPERQYQLNQMVVNNHWIYQLCLSEGAKTGTANQRYGDSGMWAAWMFQVTGDTTWAQKSYSALGVDPLQHPDFAMGGSNGVREQFTISIVILDWIWPGLTQQQKDDAITWLNIARDHVRAVGTSKYRGSLNIGDTDALAGYAGGLFLLSLFNVAENAANYNTLQNQDIYSNATPGLPIINIGGYTATALNDLTVRNRLDKITAVYGEGGVWMESSEYNLGTTRLLATLVQGWTTAVGDDKFDVAKDFFVANAYAWEHDITQNSDSIYQWGDEQNPRCWTSSFRRHQFIDSMMCAQGILAQYDLIAAQNITRTIERSIAYDPTGLTTTNGIKRGVLFFDPTIVAASAPTIPNTYSAPGVGHYYHRSVGADTYIYACTGVPVHHGTTHGVDFQMYRGDNWAITHPIGYGKAPTTSIGMNSAQLCGLSKDLQTRDLRLNESGADWLAIAWRGSGLYQSSFAYGGPPPTFLDYWERRVVSLPSDGFDCIVVQDEVQNIQDPETLPLFTTYIAADRAEIQAKWGLFVPRFHTHESATVVDNYFTWTAANGDTVRVYTLYPASVTRREIDQTATNFGGTNYAASEKRFHTEVKQTVEAANMTFLHVIVVGTGTFPTVSSSGPDQVTIGSRSVTFNANDTTVV